MEENNISGEKEAEKNGRCEQEVGKRGRGETGKSEKGSGEDKANEGLERENKTGHWNAVNKRKKKKKKNKKGIRMQLVEPRCESFEESIGETVGALKYGEEQTNVGGESTDEDIKNIVFPSDIRLIYGSLSKVKKKKCKELENKFTAMFNINLYNVVVLYYELYFYNNVDNFRVDVNFYEIYNDLICLIDELFSLHNAHTWSEMGSAAGSSVGGAVEGNPSSGSEKALTHLDILHERHLLDYKLLGGDKNTLFLNFGKMKMKYFSVEFDMVFFCEWYEEDASLVDGVGSIMESNSSRRVAGRNVHVDCGGNIRSESKDMKTPSAPGCSFLWTIGCKKKRSNSRCNDRSDDKSSNGGSDRNNSGGLDGSNLGGSDRNNSEGLDGSNLGGSDRNNSEGLDGSNRGGSNNGASEGEHEKRECGNDFLFEGENALRENEITCKEVLPLKEEEDYIKGDRKLCYRILCEEQPYKALLLKGDLNLSSSNGLDKERERDAIHAKKVATGVTPNWKHNLDNLHAATGADNLHAATGADNLHAATGADNLHAATVADNLHAATVADNLHAATVADNLHAATVADNLHAATNMDILPVNVIIRPSGESGESGELHRRMEIRNDERIWGKNSNDSDMSQFSPRTKSACIPKEILNITCLLSSPVLSIHNIKSLSNVNFLHGCNNNKKELYNYCYSYLIRIYNGFDVVPMEGYKFRSIIIDGANVCAKIIDNRNGSHLWDPDVEIVYDCFLLHEAYSFFKKKNVQDIIIVLNPVKKKDGEYFLGNKKLCNYSYLEDLIKLNAILISNEKIYNSRRGRIIKRRTYDDVLILQLASHRNGCVISNDNYADIGNKKLNQNEIKDIISHHVVKHGYDKKKGFYLDLTKKPLKFILNSLFQKIT
ncbi:hypothetical protein POVWA1_005370 [Plasmodium ovale wallikeri]|uniref:RNase NYN domain-containing protein n=1 Tax=Plasmodium ovale wallikeri TaxID=864142 RepID=A0A1A8YHP9_PLAOA|nr:hypothetical protein POVWA1_005370 [Plasmodium ovale wallikeri]